MARERGQASGEAGGSMRHWMWAAEKSRDAMVCPFCHKKIWPAGKKGTPDFPKVQIPCWDLQKMVDIAVEVKAGDSSLAFDRVSVDQRLWAEENPEFPMFIWLCLGDRINSPRRPRRTWLLPFELFLEFESDLLELGRKSIPYDYGGLDGWELEWAGKGIWELPIDHPIMTLWVKGE